MEKKYDLSVKTGEKDGKAFWKNVGVVMQSDKGMFMLLDKTFNPAGVQDGKPSCLIAMFPPSEKPAADSAPEMF